MSGSSAGSSGMEVQQGIGTTLALSAPYERGAAAEIARPLTWKAKELDREPEGDLHSTDNSHLAKTRRQEDSSLHNQDTLALADVEGGKSYSWAQEGKDYQRGGTRKKSIYGQVAGSRRWQILEEVTLKTGLHSSQKEMAGN